MITRITTKKDVYGHYNFRLEEFRKHSHYNFMDWFYLTSFESYNNNRKEAMQEAKNFFKISFLGSA